MGVRGCRIVAGHYGGDHHQDADGKDGRRLQMACSGMVAVNLREG